MKEIGNDIIINKNKDPQLYNLLLIIKNTKFGRIDFGEARIKEIKLVNSIPYYVIVEKRILLSGENVEVN